MVTEINRKYQEIAKHNKIDNYITTGRLVDHMVTEIKILKKKKPNNKHVVCTLQAPLNNKVQIYKRFQC